MALIICPDCGNMVSDKAPVCPKCGLTNPYAHLTDQSSANDPNPNPENPTERKPLSFPENNGSTPYGQDGFDNGYDNDNNNGSNRTLWILLIILLIAAIALGIYFFIENQKEQERVETERREQLRRDSIAAEEARAEAEARAAALEQLRRDSIEWYSFTSPDLTLLDLHGHVKSVSLSGDAYLTLINSFSNEFNLNKEGEITNLLLSRNKQGQIVTIKKKIDYMPDYYEQINIKWSESTPKSLNGNGIDWCSYESLTYSNGSLLSTQSESGAEGYTFTNETTIIPSEFDDFDNWTKANIVCKETEDGSEYGEGIKTNSGSYIIHRTITYYPFQRY